MIQSKSIMIAVAVVIGTGLLWADKKTEVRLRTPLAGAEIHGVSPSGSADFRSDATRGRSRLNVEVEHVKLEAGTVLDVAVQRPGGAAHRIGHITLNGFGAGELELESEHGDAVPAIQPGDIVIVMNGATAILSGTF